MDDDIDKKKREMMEVVMDGRKGKLYKVTPNNNIPEGATRMDSRSVGLLRAAALEKRPLKERWPLFSPYIVAGTTLVTSSILTYNMRYKLGLFATGGRLTAYGFACVAPSVLSGLIYDLTIKQQILNGTDPHCSVCLPTRASCIHLVMGWLLPTVYSFFITSYTARTHYTVYMPPATKPKLLIQELNKISLRLRPLMGVSALLSMAVPFGATVLQKQLVEDMTFKYQLEQEKNRRIQEGSMDWGSNESQERIQKGGKSDR